MDELTKRLVPALCRRAAFAGVLLIAAAAPARSQDNRVDELERKVDALTREIQDLKLGSVADTMRTVPRLGLGVGASKVYAARGVSIGGYGEMLYENFDADATRSGARDRIDFLRQVLYLGFKFNESLLFNSEIELEHAGVRDVAEVAVDTTTGTGTAELSGEVVLEFAYVDWMLRPDLGIRAGMLLVPLGLTNEIHEPTAFLGARRPEVEQRIIPTTWSANGIGIHGRIPGSLAYRLYLVEGLDARGFSASSVIRDGRQGGSQSLFSRPAWVARVDHDGIPGLTFGASVFTGDSWQEPMRPTPGLEARVTLWDAHLRYEGHGLEARALMARGRLDDSAALSAILSESIPDRFRGHYVEAGYDLMQQAARGSSYRLVPYLRFEQIEIPVGSSTKPTLFTFGAAFQPHPNVTLKVDREERTSSPETSQWNVALGYVF